MDFDEDSAYVCCRYKVNMHVSLEIEFSFLEVAKPLPHRGTGSAGTLDLETFKVGAEMDAG